ncbi:DNA oxidative demethylase [Tanacetum coccineum]
MEGKGKAMQAMLPWYKPPDPDDEMNQARQQSSSTANMYVLDGEGKLKKHDTPRELLEDFYRFRLDLYEKRKVNISASRAQDSFIATEKQRELKEITGSGIFAAGGENGVEETDAVTRTPSNPTGIWMYQQAVAGISHISFGEEETVSPKKSISEAKQRELSGTLDSESETRLKKQISDAKNRELSGHNIFAPPPEFNLAHWLLVHWLLEKT